MGKGAYLNKTGSKWFQGFSERCKFVRKKGGMYRRCNNPNRIRKYENFGICEEESCPRLKGERKLEQTTLEGRVCREKKA